MTAQPKYIPTIVCRTCQVPNPEPEKVCIECGDWVEDAIKAVFRISRSRPGSPFNNFHDVFALFPEISGDSSGSTCMSYAHIGQHGSADYRGMIRETDPATPEQYADLFSELEGMGYRLKVIRKATPKMEKIRRKHAFLA